MCIVHARVFLLSLCLLGGNNGVTSTTAPGVRPPTVAMTFRVEPRLNLLPVGSDARLSSEPLLLRRNTDAAICTSRVIFDLAAREPGVRNLAILREKSDFVEWACKHVTVSYPLDSEVVEVRMVGEPTDSSQDIVKLMKAIKKAYLSKSSDDAQLIQLRRVSELKACREKLQQSYLVLSSAVRKLEGGDAKDDNASAIIAIRRCELTSIEDVLRQLNKQILAEEVNLHNLPTIYWLQEPMEIGAKQDGK